jgi:hypothetical protein
MVAHPGEAPSKKVLRKRAVSTTCLLQRRFGISIVSLHCCVIFKDIREYTLKILYEKL